MKNYAFWGALLMSCLAPACGDDSADDGGDSCGKVAACGGDITGEWTAVDSCISFDAGIGSNCPEATVDTSGVHVSGSLSYNADGTYASNDTISGAVTVTLPAKCLQENGGTKVTCAQITDASKGTEREMSCANASGGGCACTMALKTISGSEAGTYTINGNTVVETHDGETERTDYCVSGGDLHLIVPPSASDIGISGGAVFKRK